MSIADRYAGSVGAMPLPDQLALIVNMEGADMFQVCAFDPGGTTGWAVFHVHEVAMYDPGYPILANVEYWWAGEFSGALVKQSDEMVELCEAWEDADIVSEDFILRQFLPGREVLDPVRLNFALECRVRPRIVAYQQSSLAMSVVTDDRMRAWGFWNPLAGKPHARDAVRHAVTYLRRRKDSVAQLSAELAIEMLRAGRV